MLYSSSVLVACFMINGTFHLLIDQSFACSNEGVVLIYHDKEGAKPTACSLLVHQYSIPHIRS